MLRGRFIPSRLLAQRSDKVGRDRTRRDAVAGDLPLGDRERGREGQALDRPLRHGIARGKGLADLPRHRADIDDAPAIAKPRQRGLRYEMRALYIDREKFIEQGLTRTLERTVAPAPPHACIVDQYVEVRRAAELPVACSEYRLDAG